MCNLAPCAEVLEDNICSKTWSRSWGGSKTLGFGAPGQKGQPCVPFAQGFWLLAQQLLHRFGEAGKALSTDSKPLS